MSPFDIIRAWKSEAFRNNLTAAQRAELLANPAGLIELTEAELDIVAGGSLITRGSCQQAYFTKTGSCAGSGKGHGTGTGTGGNCSKVACCQKPANKPLLRRAK